MNTSSFYFHFFLITKHFKHIFVETKHFFLFVKICFFPAQLISTKETGKWFITCYRAQLSGFRMLTNDNLKNNLVYKNLQTRAPQMFLAPGPGSLKPRLFETIVKLLKTIDYFCKALHRWCLPDAASVVIDDI